MPGTYHGVVDQAEEIVNVVFEVGAGEQVVLLALCKYPLGLHQTILQASVYMQSVQVPLGSNLLRAAEAAGAVTPNRSGRNHLLQETVVALLMP